MSFESLSEKYDFRKIKTNYTYNNSKLRITEIKRQDGEHMSRKAVIKLCDSFQAEFGKNIPTCMVSSQFLLSTPNAGLVGMCHRSTNQLIISRHQILTWILKTQEIMNA